MSEAAEHYGVFIDPCRSSSRWRSHWSVAGVGRRVLPASSGVTIS